MGSSPADLRSGVGTPRFGFESTIRYLKARGLVHRIAEDERLEGRIVTLGGRAVVNFGSCSYLGLESDPRLKLAACEAVMRYGTQFSSSRAYVAAPLYRTCEGRLGAMAGGYPVVLAATTSLAHLAAVPVLVDDGDAVIYDLHVHSSVHAVLPTLRQRGIHCQSVGHADMAHVERRARALSARHRRIFYLCDGVYSMHGSVLDVAALRGVLDRIPALIAYVDDAHGVGWSGRFGAGTVVGAPEGLHERMVVALGLSKAFAACGGALVFPDREMAERVLFCGSTLMFSGPLQPAQLGACAASALLHLSADLPPLQERLRERIAAFDERAARAGLPLSSWHPTPIRIVPVGDEERAMRLAERLLAAGYYVNVAVFPAVPEGRAAIRVMLNNHHGLDDVRAVADALAAGLESSPEIR
jgi:7-keto-8-aminopelargonate synthetase-like enzyme